MAKLSDLEIDEVSLVRKGANQHSKVVIAKSGETEGDNVPGYFDPETGAPVDLETLEFGRHVLDENGEEFLWTADDEADDNEQELVDVGKSAFNAPRTSAISVNTNGPQGLAEGLKTQLSKALTDSERDTVISKAFEQIDALAKQAAQAEEIAKAERDQRRYSEYLTISKNYSLPVSDEELATVMMHVEDALPEEDVAIIAKCFQAASEALFEEQGRIGGGDNDDVMSRVSAAVDGSVSKSGDVSREAAVVDAFMNDPSLYSQWTSEHYGYSHGR